MPTSIDVGYGCRIVPFKAVALNGVVVAVLEIEANDTFALILPDGKAAMCGESRRPYRYESEREAREDAEVICEEETNDAPPGAGGVGSDRAGGVPGGTGFTPSWHASWWAPQLALYRAAEEALVTAQKDAQDAQAEAVRVTNEAGPVVDKFLIGDWDDELLPHNRTRWDEERLKAVAADNKRAEARQRASSALYHWGVKKEELLAATVALAAAVSDHTFRAEDIEKNGGYGDGGGDENDPTLKTKG